MEINVKISDYLSEEEIKEIVQDEFRGKVRSILDEENNLERVISNCAYRDLGEELEKLVHNYKDILNEYIKKVFNSKDSISYELFRGGISPSREGRGTILIEEYVNNNKKMLEDKIKETILDCDFSDKIYSKAEDLINEMSDNMYEFINLLKNKDNGK